MLTLSQLLVLTRSTEARKFKGSYRLSHLTAKSNEDSVGSYLLFSSVVEGGEEPRKSSVKIYSDTLKIGAPTQVWCTCRYFSYFLALPLSMAGSSILEFDLEDIPEKYREIKRKPGLCPHLLVLAENLSTLSKKELLQLLHPKESRISINDRLKNLA